MPTLQVRLFGPLDISVDGQPLSKPATSKSQSLLAYLIHHRHQPQPRERLAGLFWGDRPEPKARQSLATALWQIRRCFPAPDPLLCASRTVQFATLADLWLDVAEFESRIACEDVAGLEAAVALYRGDFLDGFYDDWILNERYRLETLYSAALARLMVAQEADRTHATALLTAQRLLQHDRVREEAHRLVMRAYCRLGQRNAALQQYRHCREVVRQELGAEPMVETTELYRAILEGRFAAGHTVAVIPPVGAEGPLPQPFGRSPLDVIQASKLVGRERELEFLQACWQRAEGGQGGLVLVRGEAGVGKTRLAEEFADRLRWQGAWVLWGRCYEFERLLPFQPISEALRTVLPTLTRAELADVPPWTIGEVTRLVPEMAEQTRHLGVPASIDSSQEQARLFEGVSCFLSRMSSHEPLLMVLEDLHWASESTLQMLHYLARHLAGCPSLLVGTLRPEAVGRRHPLLAIQRRLSREGLARGLHLPRLSPKAVEAIVVEMSAVGEAVVPLAGRLYRETQGNPFFLMEIVKALFEANLICLEEDTGPERSRRAWRGDFSRLCKGDLPLPASLSETIQARVDRLDDDVQEVLRLAAVLGREFDLDMLSAVCGRGEEAVLEAVDVLLRRRLLDEGGGAMGRDYAFTQHKIQEVIYARLRGRRLLHRRVAEAVERLQPDDVVALAWHFERAGQPGRAARCALQAGLAAKDVFAHAEARTYFDRALTLLEQDAVRLRDSQATAANRKLQIEALHERGWALRLLGDMEAYACDLQEVARLAESLGDQRTLAHLHWREAYTHRWFCRYAKAREAAEDCVHLSRAAADRSLEAMCQREIGMAARATGDYDRSRAALERALSLLVDLDDAVYEIHVLGNLSTLYWCVGEYDRAMDLSRRALARCEEVGLPFERRLALGDLGAAAAAAGDGDLARRCLLESLSIARQIADRTQEILCLGHLGWLCVRQKQAAQALEHLQAALALAEQIDSRTEQSWLLSGLAEAYRLSDDPLTGAGESLDLAVAHASRALKLAQASGRAYDQKLARQILAGLRKADLQAFRRR